MSDGPDSAPWRPPRWAVALLLLGAFLTVRGYHSRDGDQAYRLPILLHQLDPALYAHDPFVRAFDTFNPHRGYLALLAGLTRLLGLSAALLIPYLATFFLTLSAFDRLARAAWPDSPPAVGAVAGLLVLLTRAGNIGDNHLFDATLLDRLLALSLGWHALAESIAAPRPRFLRVALPLAAAGLIHPSLGLQLAMLLAAAALAWPLARVLPARSAPILLAAAALAVLPVLAQIAPQSARLLEGLPPDQMWTWAVLVQGPQHMVPHLWRTPQWLAWACFPALALYPCLAAPRGTVTPPCASRRRLAVLLALLLAALAAATAGIEVLHHLRLALFQPFRMATVVRGLCLVLIARHVLDLWARRTILARLRAVFLGVSLTSDYAFVIATLAEALALFAEHLLHRSPEAAPPTIIRPQHWPQARKGPRPSPAANPHHPATRLAPTPASSASPLRSPCPEIGDPDRRERKTSLPLGVSAPPTPAAFAWSLALAAGIVHLSRHDPTRGHLILLGTLAAALPGILLLDRFRPAWTPARLARWTTLAWTVPLACLVLPAVAPDSPLATRLAAHARFGETPTDDLECLALWCRRNTPIDARFIGPPGPKTFRLWSRRALMFNRAGSPYHAAGLADWSARFRAHVDFRGTPAEFARLYATDRQSLERRYDALPDARLAALAAHQGATHILARTRTLPPDSPLEPLHTSGRWTIYRPRQPAQPAQDNL